MTDRRVRRKPDRQSFDRALLYALLDDELIGHLATVVDGEPLVIPTAFARVDDHVLIHGSTGAGFALRPGARVALSVAALDGLVLARSLKDSSMNYRSAVIYGVLEPTGADEHADALVSLSEKLIPGRTAEVRESSAKELAMTSSFRLALDDAVVKVRAAGPTEDAGDGEDHGVWAGVVPTRRAWGPAVASPLTMASAHEPKSVQSLTG